MAASITEQQILDAINAARKHDDSNPHGALTCKEISKATGMGKGWVTKMLGDLAETGTIKVTRIHKTRLDGMQQWVPAYFCSLKND